MLAPGRKGDPLYIARRVLHTGADLHTEKQAGRLKSCSRAMLTARARQPVGSTSALSRHLRGAALAFRSLTNYIVRSLLEAGGFRLQVYAGL
jgi:hypothetical protein